MLARGSPTQIDKSLPPKILSQRALNRALLARQHLLQRRKASAADEIEHLVGMQAQVPNSPYVGLWTRLDGFKPDQLADLISNGVLFGSA